MECPLCDVNIPEYASLVTFPHRYEIKDVIGAEQLEKIQMDYILSMIAQDESLVRCSCNEVLEIVAGVVDPNQKDDFGMPISEAARENMSQFRIRCRSCARVFCTNCGADPYHLGKTCEEFKNFQEARKCRFCGQAIRPGEGRENVKPAFNDVCREQDCEDLMSKSCDKMLPCGHHCCGFRGEEQCLPCLHEDCVAK